MASTNHNRASALAPDVTVLRTRSERHRVALPAALGRLLLGRAPALAVENARLQAELCALTVELQRSRARTVAAAARERRRLERELHDSAQNRILGMQIRLELALERAQDSAPELAASLAGLLEETDRVNDELRRIAGGHAPVLLATGGVLQALRAEAKASAAPVTVDGSRIGRSTGEIESAVYLSCLEAIQNAAKHAGRGASVIVRLWGTGDELAFAVVDDGCGFESSPNPGGSGLAGIRDRIGAVRGRVDVTSGLGRGVTVAGAVPWPPRDS